MPRLSRPTLKPNASSACVTAFSSDRDWASAVPDTDVSAIATNFRTIRGREPMPPSPAPGYDPGARGMIPSPARPTRFLQDAAGLRLICERSQDTKQNAQLIRDKPL